MDNTNSFNGYRAGEYSIPDFSFSQPAGDWNSQEPSSSNNSFQASDFDQNAIYRSVYRRASDASSFRSLPRSGRVRGVASQYAQRRRDLAFGSLPAAHSPSSVLSPNDPYSLVPKDVNTGLPIQNFFADSNSPWSALAAVPATQQNNFLNPPQGHITVRECAQPSIPDSGYYTAQRAPSIHSESFNGYSPNSQTIDLGLSALELESMVAASQIGEDEPAPDQGQVAQNGRSRSKSNRGGERTCETCHQQFPCQSDLKKHKLKHHKPHTCDIAGCSRANQGFGTLNDLNRHKKSVHSIGLAEITKSFQCKAPECKDPQKIWPRLDNFKQHIDRMHKGVDVDEIVAQSRYTLPAVAEDVNQSMDQDLGGVGALAGQGVLFPQTIDPEDLHLGHDAALLCNGQTSNSQRDYEVSRNGTVFDQLNETPVLGPKGSSEDTVSTDHVDDPHAQLKDIVRKLQKSSAEQDVHMARKLQSLLETTQPHTSSMSVSDNHSLTSSREPRRIFCPEPKCNKSFARSCELNKHKLRHQRPWVCTASHCDHRSGSKSDWIRHERQCQNLNREINSPIDGQLYVCLHPVTTPLKTKCGYGHRSSELFKAHLHSQHRITHAQQVEQLLSRWALPQPDESKGWCGFCLDIVTWEPLKTSRSPMSKSPAMQAASNNSASSSSTGTSAKEKAHIQPHLANQYMSSRRVAHIEAHMKNEGRSLANYTGLDEFIGKGPGANSQWLTGTATAANGNGTGDAEFSESTLRAAGQKRHHSAIDASDDEPRDRRGIWVCCQCKMYHVAKLVDRCTGFECQNHDRCSRCEDVPTTEYVQKMIPGGSAKHLLDGS